MGRIDLKTLFGAGSAFSEPTHWNSCHPRVSGIALDVCNEHDKHVPRLIVVETWPPEMDLSDDFSEGTGMKALYLWNKSWYDYPMSQCFYRWSNINQAVVFGKQYLHYVHNN